MKISRLGLVFICSLLLSPFAVAQHNLLSNGNFDTGDLTGWNVVNSGAGAFTVYNGPGAPFSGAPIPLPPSGPYASLADQGGPGSHILYQDVTLPNDGEAIFLSFLLYYNNQASVWLDDGSLSEINNPNQQLRIDIMDPNAPVDDVGAGVLLNILKPTGNDEFVFGYAPVGADLSAFAGQTVRLRFAEVDNQFFFQVAVDDVVISHPQDVPATQPATLTLLVLGIMLFAGVILRRA